MTHPFEGFQSLSVWIEVAGACDRKCSYHADQEGEKAEEGRRVGGRELERERRAGREPGVRCKL